MTKALEIKNLTKFYGRKKVLDNLNMNVSQNKVYGLLGINGSGKTTTFGILGGFLKKHSGIFSINGKAAILPQDARFYADRSIISQLKLFASLSGVKRRDIKKEIDRVLKIVNLQESKKMKPENLSHGMYKRLAIAQALLGNPDIIMLDEPTSGLDPQNVYEIKKLIIGLNKEKTVIISSHILDEVKEMCEEVGIIHEGKMRFEGKISEIINIHSNINFHLSEKVDLTILNDIEEIQEKEIDHERLILSLIFNESQIKPEEINAKVLKILHENNIGIKEITRGQSLEDGFLNILS